MGGSTVIGGGRDGVDGVREALRSDVISIIQKEVEALRPLTRDSAYDRVMNSPLVLDGCFRLFRAKPELFRDVVTDKAGRPVTGDNALLSCGRTLADAIALIVRAAAKRYFRSHSDSMAPPASGSANDPKSSPDALYSAMRENLRYEWQPQLIPNYARMPVSLVRFMGERLLDFREPAELTSLADGADFSDGHRTPLLLDNAQRLMIRGRPSIDPEVLWRVCQQMDIARLYPCEDARGLRRAVAQISTAQPEALAPMLPVLGHDIRRFAVFLFVVHAILGAHRFKSVFGEGGQTYVVQRWMDRLASMPPANPRLAEMQSAYEDVISSSHEASALSVS